MRRLCTAAAVALAVLVAGLATAGAVALRGGISARVEPSGLEAAVARRARNFLIPGSAASARNPIPADAETLAEGRAHFADHCASCHGNDGGGRTELGRALYPRAPDMRAAATQELTDGQLFWVIEHGIRFTGMPGWGGAGKPEGSWKLVHFIRHLPALSPEELAEMERGNPRSAHEWRELQEDEEFLRGGEVRSHDGHGK